MRTEQAETIDRALRLAREQIENCPSNPLLIVIESQLKYVRRVLSGKRLYELRACRINIGAYGAMAFCNADPSYANLLMDSQRVVDSLGG